MMCGKRCTVKREYWRNVETEKAEGDGRAEERQEVTEEREILIN